MPRGEARTDHVGDVFVAERVRPQHRAHAAQVALEGGSLDFAEGPELRAIVRREVDVVGRGAGRVAEHGDGFRAVNLACTHAFQPGFIRASAEGRIVVQRQGAPRRAAVALRGVFVPVELAPGSGNHLAVQVVRRPSCALVPLVRPLPRVRVVALLLPEELLVFEYVKHRARRSCFVVILACRDVGNFMALWYWIQAPTSSRCRPNLFARTLCAFPIYLFRIKDHWRPRHQSRRGRGRQLHVFFDYHDLISHVFIITIII